VTLSSLYPRGRCTPGIQDGAPLSQRLRSPPPFPPSAREVSRMARLLSTLASWASHFNAPHARSPPRPPPSPSHTAAGAGVAAVRVAGRVGRARGGRAAERAPRRRAPRWLLARRRAQPVAGQRESALKPERQGGSGLGSGMGGRTWGAAWAVGLGERHGPSDLGSGMGRRTWGAARWLLAWWRAQPVAGRRECLLESRVTGSGAPVSAYAYVRRKRQTLRLL